MSQKNELANLLHHLVALLARESDQILQEQLGIGLSQYKILSSHLDYGFRPDKYLVSRQLRMCTKIELVLG